ncbi:MAG: 3-hydroxyacyl-CoA dehydrogenase NAD-binding domain-containing protein [Candidatus Bathyarchaeota archaeon]|nr:3-hydroxyacyl-CoA dehydrogenase NAD-binding domain-containing protein [Candidatus Bathyarchaeota archaeon]
MPSALALTPQDLLTFENHSNYTIAVVGCGQRGVLYADQFAGAGFNVVCSDADQSLVKRLAKGKSVFVEPEVEKNLKKHITKGNLKASNEIKDVVAKSDIVVLAVPLKIDDKKNSRSQEIVNVCKQIGSVLPEGSLVIYGEISGFGLLEGIIKETLENTSGLSAGKDFGLAYAPYPNKPNHHLAFNVAAQDPVSLNCACTVLSVLSPNVVSIDNVRVAELTQLFEAVKDDLQLALANELAVYCEKAGVDYFEILKLLNLPSTSFYPAVSEEKNSDQIFLMLESSENLNTTLRLPTLARQINEAMLKHGVALTQEALVACDKTLRRARVAVFGAVNPDSSTEQFAKLLVQKGAKTRVYDPLLSRTDVSETSSILKKTSNEAFEGVDCIVIFSRTEQFKRLNLKKIHTLMKSPCALVDLIGVVEPVKVEAAGFIYRGLGRGLKKN